jgi:hypothetical protein
LKNVNGRGIDNRKISMGYLEIRKICGNLKNVNGRRIDGRKRSMGYLEINMMTRIKKTDKEY